MVNPQNEVIDYGPQKGKNDTLAEDNTISQNQKPKLNNKKNTSNNFTFRQ